MKKLTKYYRHLQVAYIKTALFIITVSALLLPNLDGIKSTGDNIFSVFLNGENVGTVASEDDVDAYIREVRKEIAKSSDSIVFMETNMEFKGSEVFFGLVDNKTDVKERIKKVLTSSVKETIRPSYTVKVNDLTVNLSSSEEVVSLLNAALDKYDPNNIFEADLALDSSRELNVLTTTITSPAKEEAVPEFETQAGIELSLTEMTEELDSVKEKEFSDYELGLSSIGYSEPIEVVEAYLREDELTDYTTALSLLVDEQEEQQIYEVVPGDTLSGIAYMHNLPLTDIIAMNDAIENENSVLQIGQQIIITVPKPELSVEWKEEQYYEEAYEADVIYVPNDEWYTNQQVVLQEPSSGYRKVVAEISHSNDAELGRTILKEEVVAEAVPKIVERGTKIPPTYIKPLSGGRLSSTFGKRTAPVRGASTYHEGIDWSTPVGTPIVASSSGTVARAGWASGYGYVVYINHADGKQTRYAHLSKVLCSVGQYVNQGDRIASSGNTGRSSGPHVHFEILINGSQVNPLNYLN